MCADITTPRVPQRMKDTPPAFASANRAGKKHNRRVFRVLTSYVSRKVLAMLLASDTRSDTFCACLRMLSSRA